MNTASMAHFLSRYAVSELQADVDRLLAEFPEPEREKNKTKFGIFVGECYFHVLLLLLMRCIQCTTS